MLSEVENNKLQNAGSSMSSAGNCVAFTAVQHSYVRISVLIIASFVSNQSSPGVESLTGNTGCYLCIFLFPLDELIHGHVIVSSSLDC